MSVKSKQAKKLTGKPVKKSVVIPFEENFARAKGKTKRVVTRRGEHLE